jgi:DNA replicative helicase MCM subunit Mcm2 (Cdc46/Mcm family)
MLKSPAPNLPEDIELRWIESEEEVREHVEDIFEAFNEYTQQSVSQEQVTEAAERYGISPAQTETAIEILTSEEVIIESDDGFRVVDENDNE